MKHPRRIIALGLLVAGAAFAVSSHAQAQGIGGRLRRAGQTRTGGHTANLRQTASPVPNQKSEKGSASHRLTGH